MEAMRCARRWTSNPVTASAVHAPGFEATDRAFMAFHRYGSKNSRMSRDPAADAAFSEFATASRTRLRNTAYLLCGDWDQASDHVQEGLIRVYVAWPRLVRSGGELAYARKAVVSAFLDASRKRSNREHAADVSSARASDEDVATAVTDRAALMVALARLPERRRACIVLRYFEDLDVGDTATALGCSEGTVKSQTSRALETLRSMFATSGCDGVTVIGDGHRPW
jgi:RNA polymerase sigma-70 factor (sigma-E family)